MGRSKSSSDPRTPTLSTSTSDPPHDHSSRRRSVVVAFGATLAVGGAVVVGLLGGVVGLGWWPALAGAVLGAVVGRVLVQRSVERVVVSVEARPLRDAPRIENLVAGICVARGITPPRLCVVETSGRNACTVGLGAAHSTIIVTRGLLDDLSRIELEGVVARELALVKSGQAALATVTATIATVWPGAVERLLPHRSDLLADVDAVAVTRYPPGLVGALEKVRTAPSVGSAPRWTRHLWIEDPGAPADGRAGTFHSAIDERIATLREL